jgi:hypothetical protein
MLRDSQNTARHITINAAATPMSSFRTISLEIPQIILNEPPRRKQRGIKCHAGLDPASSLDFWIPAFAGMTLRRKRMEY